MGFTVNKCWCLSTKDKEMYPVFPATKAEVKELLYKGR